MQSVKAGISHSPISVLAYSTLSHYWWPFNPVIFSPRLQCLDWWLVWLHISMLIPSGHIRLPVHRWLPVVASGHLTLPLSSGCSTGVRGEKSWHTQFLWVRMSSDQRGFSFFFFWSLSLCVALMGNLIHCAGKTWRREMHTQGKGNTIKNANRFLFVHVGEQLFFSWTLHKTLIAAHCGHNSTWYQIHNW